MGLTTFLKFISPSIGARRNRESLALLHSTAYPIVFRYIAFRVADREVVEELTDELFAHLLKEPDNHQKDHLFPQRLLLSLATKAVQRYQHNNTHPVATAVSGAKIQAAMAALSDEHQILLALCYGCRLTIEQVAQALNQTPEEARRGQARAIMALHERMQCL